MRTTGLASKEKDRLPRVRAIAQLFPTLGWSAKAALWDVIGTAVMIGLFTYLGTAALSENTQRNQQERVVLAGKAGTLLTRGG